MSQPVPSTSSKIKTEQVKMDVDDPILEMDNVYKSFGRHDVLQGMSLKVARGKTTVIIGRSGEGKSVTLKHMMGLMHPDKGRVLVEGEDLGTMDKRALLALRKQFGICFQHGALFDSMNVGENVAFPLVEHTKLRGAELQAKVQEKLEAVGLNDVQDKMPSELSGGMRKRVGLARAMALDPGIILFDEPTSGLDPVMTSVIDEMIMDTQARFGLTAVVISHDLMAAFRVADRMAMLYLGKIIAYGTPDEFRASDNPIVQQFLAGRSEGPMRVR